MALLLRAGIVLQAVIDFLSMHGLLSRCIYSDSDLIPLYAQNRDRDIVLYHQAFAHSACQYQHDLISFAVTCIPCSV
jgi:hypothetical protein